MCRKCSDVIASRSILQFISDLPPDMDQGSVNEALDRLKHRSDTTQDAWKLVFEAKAIGTDVNRIFNGESVERLLSSTADIPAGDAVVLAAAVKNELKRLQVMRGRVGSVFQRIHFSFMEEIFHYQDFSHSQRR